LIVLILVTQAINLFRVSHVQTPAARAHSADDAGEIHIGVGCTLSGLHILLQADQKVRPAGGRARVAPVGLLEAAVIV
jgi:hypothetical protein